MIGDNIRRLREFKGMTRREFGELIRVSQDTINNVERGRVEVSGMMIKCICDTFGVSEEWLLYGDDEPQFSIDPLETEIRSNVQNSPAMRSLLATWAQLSDENKAVFEKFAADYVADYNRRNMEQTNAEHSAFLDNAVAEEKEIESIKKSS